MSINDVFGEARFGGNKTHWFKFPKEGGSLVLRILPPYGSLRAKGRWNQYYAIHFGYRDIKGNLRPFQSCEVVNRQSKMVEVTDPAVERIKKLKMAQDKAKVEGNQEIVKKIGEQLQIFNLKKSYYMNVMDLQGKIGVFSIPHKMKQALDEEINRLQAKGVNPLSVGDGRYFVFTRTGFGPSSTHKVSVYSEDSVMNGIQVQVEKKHSLTEDVAERIKYEGADLGSLYISPTPEEIANIINGGPAALEQVFAKYRSSGGDDNGYGDDEYFESTPAPTATVTQKAAPQVQNGQTVVKAEVQNTAPPVAAGQDLSQMDNAEFLKLMGI